MRVFTLPRIGTIRQIGAVAQQLRLPAQRSRADARTLRQGREAWCLLRKKHVARVVARQHAGDLQPLGQPSLDILQRMHGEVDMAVDQRLIDLLGEQALAADLGKRGDPAPGRRSCGS